MVRRRRRPHLKGMQPRSSREDRGHKNRYSAGKHGPSLKQAREFVREILDDRGILDTAAGQWGRRKSHRQRLAARTLIDVQLRGLELCQTLPTTADGWFSLQEAGLRHSTIRVLQVCGAIEARYIGFPGQTAGQLYRVTPIGLDALAASACLQAGRGKTERVLAASTQPL
jgi:hypothetical protein